MSYSGYRYIDYRESTCAMIHAMVMHGGVVPFASTGNEGLPFGYTFGQYRGERGPLLSVWGGVSGGERGGKRF